MAVFLLTLPPCSVRCWKPSREMLTASPNLFQSKLVSPTNRLEARICSKVQPRNPTGDNGPGSGPSHTLSKWCPESGQVGLHKGRTGQFWAMAALTQEYWTEECHFLFLLSAYVPSSHLNTHFVGKKGGDIPLSPLPAANFQVLQLHSALPLPLTSCTTTDALPYREGAGCSKTLGAGGWGIPPLALRQCLGLLSCCSSNYVTSFAWQ